MAPLNLWVCLGKCAFFGGFSHLFIRHFSNSLYLIHVQAETARHSFTLVCLGLAKKSCLPVLDAPGSFSKVVNNVADQAAALIVFHGFAEKVTCLNKIIVRICKGITVSLT